MNLNSRIKIYTLVAVFLAITYVIKINSDKEPLPVIGSIPEFEFVDSEGKSISLNTLKGKVWVADFIFTTCTMACPIMTGNMNTIHKKYKKNDDESLSEVVTVVENFAGIDPSIVEYNGLWYIFATDGSVGSNSHLNIYYSENPLTSWKEHSLNPVKINVRSSRGGGEIIKEGVF